MLWYAFTISFRLFLGTLPLFLFSPSGLEAYIRFQINSWFPLWFSKAYNFLWFFFSPNCQSQEHLITLYSPVKEEFSYVYARRMAHPSLTLVCLFLQSYDLKAMFCQI